MKIKQLLKKYRNQQKDTNKILSIGMLLLLISSAIISIFIPESASTLTRLGIALTNLVFVAIILGGLFNYYIKGQIIISYEHDIKNKITSADDLKFLLKARQQKLILSEKIGLPIYFNNLNQELQKDILNKFNKQDLQLFNDFDQIYKTKVFKEVLANRYPPTLHSKLFVKLNSSNFIKLLKDVPKTKIDDFLEDRVKKTIA